VRKRQVISQAGWLGEYVEFKILWACGDCPFEVAIGDAIMTVKSDVGIHAKGSSPKAQGKLESPQGGTKQTAEGSRKEDEDAGDAMGKICWDDFCYITVQLRKRGDRRRCQYDSDDERVLFAGAKLLDIVPATAAEGHCINKHVFDSKAVLGYQARLQASLAGQWERRLAREAREARKADTAEA
jgi:hypothetical protein